MLERLITSDARRRILSLFLTNPKSRFYLREVAKLTSLPVNAARKELLNLADMGLLKRDDVANLAYYCVNPDFSLFSDLRQIIIKTHPINGQVSSVADSMVAEFGRNLHSLVLFGSVAREDFRLDSDIDILAVCGRLPSDWRKRDEIVLGFERMGLKSGRTVHVSMLTLMEFEFSVMQGAPLLFEISLDHRILYDDGTFDANMAIFRENMMKWKAKKIDDNTWEVPGLAVKT
jgi:hypothetical protein